MCVEQCGVIICKFCRQFCRGRVINFHWSTSVCLSFGTAGLVGKVYTAVDARWGFVNQTLVNNKSALNAVKTCVRKIRTGCPLITVKWHPA